MGVSAFEETDKISSWISLSLFACTLFFWVLPRAVMAS
jgi:hypothetical protein